jgi:hypothetical protein
MKDGREAAHKIARMLWQNTLPMLGDNADAVVLLCWGQQYHCSIILVSISDSDDEVATWREINQAWYAHRGWWRKYIPSFGVEHVDIVEVCPRVQELPLSTRLTNIPRFQSWAGAQKSLMGLGELLNSWVCT